MIGIVRQWRRSTRLAIVAALMVSLLGAGAVVGAVVAPAITTFTPRSANQITNIDVLRQQIRNYYGDPLASGVFAPDSNYAKEAKSVAAQGLHYLLLKKYPWQYSWKGSKTKAIVLDVDDTTLATWNYEVYSNWAYNPTTNGTFVNCEKFPAVPGMVAMVNKAKSLGYAVFYLTGRPASQEPVTLTNLTGAGSLGGVGCDAVPGNSIDAGYPAPTTLKDGEDGLFTKPPSTATDYSAYPDYLLAACADEIALGKSCTTIHYKSATRAHIESLGYDIVANFGDQYSDLKGGSADRTFKMPNPNYFLP